MNLNGKTAVVTGGARGIGRAYCERLAVDGANVVIVDRRDAHEVAETLKGAGRKMALVADVSEPLQVAEASKLVIEQVANPRPRVYD